MAVGTTQVFGSEAHDAGESRYDVFLSFAGPDRVPGRELASQLRALGLQVFLDEDGVDRFSGITAGIERALNSSKSLVAYYSTEYAVRPACQLELTAAFLAGQREGDPMRRIVVINPERSTTHLQPVELADAKYAPVPATKSETELLAKAIQHRVGMLHGVIGEVELKMRPRWFGRPMTGGKGFVGRYRELWSLHSALHSADFPLIIESYHGTSVSVCGVPGAGKTALVEEYAWQFGAAYPGGVYWLSLAGTHGSTSDVLARYRDELCHIARAVGVDPGEHVVTTLANHLADDQRTSLWIIDDVPADLDQSALDALLLPAGAGVRTVLISQEDAFGAVLPTVEVGALTREDARTLLSRRRRPDSPAERKALDELAFSLGCHAGAIVEAGNHLQDQQGLLSYEELHAELPRTAERLAATIRALRPLVQRLTCGEVLLLRIAALCQSNELPTRLLQQVGVRHGTDVGRALAHLRRRAVAWRTGTTWRMHPLVVLFHSQEYSGADAQLWSSVTWAASEADRDARLSRRERQLMTQIAHTLAQTEAMGLYKEELPAHASSGRQEVDPAATGSSRRGPEPFRVEQLTLLWAREQCASS